MTDQIRGARDKHPSGKPSVVVEHRKEQPASGYRNGDEPYTRGLRQRALPPALGFLANLTRDIEE